MLKFFKKKAWEGGGDQEKRHERGQVRRSESEILILFN